MAVRQDLVANKVRDDCRSSRVEANHVEHATVVWVSEDEAVGGHAHNNGLRVDNELVAILAQRRMDLPRFTDNPNSTARRK